MSPTTPEPGQALAALAASFIAAAVLIVVVGAMIGYASRRPFPTSVVASLSVLAALALVGYAVGGEERSELAAIAGTAVGALAAATTALLARQSPARLPPPGEDDPTRGTGPGDE